MNFRIVFFYTFLTLTTVFNSYAQSYSISNALDWFAVNQNANGSYGISTTTVVDTSETIISIRANGGNDSNLQAALAWISTQEPPTIDEISRKIISISRNGDTISLVAALVSAKNTENSWGYKAGYVSTALDTALALQALKAANYPDLTLINNALAYLTANQNADGGWGFCQGDESNVFVTAHVLSTLSLFKSSYIMDRELGNAAAFLVSKQNPDGGFGSEGSTTYETALALISLLDSGQPATPALQNAVNFLTTSQLANGSWNDDAYSTALALHALALVKPDLSIVSSDMASAPVTPTVGETVTLSATVRNAGLEGAGSVAIHLLDNGTLAGEQIVASIAPGGSAAVSFTAPITPYGDHSFTIVVDPANAIPESSETNNSATFRGRGGRGGRS